jgi:hypothetical protein
MSRKSKARRTAARKASSERDLAISAVMAALPELTSQGFGVDKTWGVTFEQARAELMSPIYLHRFEQAKLWFRASRGSGNSYVLKHEAEESIGYIPNGVFIAAAMAVRYSIRRSGAESIYAELSWPRHRQRGAFRVAAAPFEAPREGTRP